MVPDANELLRRILDRYHAQRKDGDYLACLPHNGCPTLQLGCVFLEPNDPNIQDLQTEPLSKHTTPHSDFRPPAFHMTTSQENRPIHRARTESFSGYPTSHSDFHRPLGSHMTIDQNRAMYPPRPMYRPRAAAIMPTPKPPRTSRRHMKDVDLGNISEFDRVIMYVNFSRFRLIPDQIISQCHRSYRSWEKHGKFSFSPNILSVLITVQFIDAATGRIGPTIGHGLRSFTPDILPVRCPHPDNDLPVIFLDTPGFDDTYNPDYTILGRISRWLAAM
jgi:hypothetical protein